MTAAKRGWAKGGMATLLVCALNGCGSASDAPSAQTETRAVTAAGDGAAAAGKPKSVMQCVACHAVVAGKNGIGPTLAGVAGRKAGTMPGFAYSKAMVAYGETWDEITLDAYLAAPQKTVPGTKMSYAGLSNGADRKELIEYLKTLK